MYDNIDMVLGKEKANINFLEVTTNYLKNRKLFEDENTGYTSITGYLDNLKVNVSQNRVKIIESSLCKYWLGDNIKGMFRSDTEKAIEKISDELHLPFNCANISRIDVSSNFLVKYEEGLYYKYLGEKQYYKRQEAGNGLYYNNNNMQLLFYGKLHEQKVKGNTIPKHYENKNLLRYELRFKSRLPKRFNMPEILASDLFDEVFYMDVLDRWEEEYFKINKINSIISNMKPTGSTKELMNYLAIIGLNELGHSNAYAKVKEWQSKGDIDKKQASDLRKKLKEIAVIPNLTEENEMVIELDKKVKDAIQYYR